MTIRSRASGPIPDDEAWRMSREELAAELAHWCVALEYDDIPADVIDRLKTSALDATGCALGAARSEPVDISRRVADDLAASGPCTLIGSRQRTNVEHATFVNSVATRYLDYCDVFLGVEVTPPASCASVVWALCEACGLTGADCLVGMAVLYESMLRFCSAASLNRKGWDTVTYQAIASAMAAARILRLTAGQAYEAINIATTTAPALLQTRVGELSMWKGAASAYAARGGLLSALLARRGMTGPRGAFEGKHGLQAQVCGPLQLPPSNEWRSTSVLIKKYPAQVYTQSAIEATLRLRDHLGPSSPADVRKIVVTTFGRARDHTAASPDRWHPKTRESADHSLPFVGAAALLDGEIGPTQFEASRISATDIAQLLSRIEVAESPAMTDQYPGQMPAAVELHLDSQPVMSAIVLAPEGHPGRPMSQASLRAKFMSLAGRALGAARAEELRESIESLERAADIRAVTSLMAAT
jgi:2-methylcitrate dehydratase